MAERRNNNGYNGYGSYPGGGYPYGGARNASSGRKLSKKEQKQRQAKAAAREQNALMRDRQRYAIDNAAYRNKVVAIDGQGGVDSRYYKLPADVKPKKEKDYFFVMRKFVCFLMFLLLIVAVAYFVLGGVVKIDAIPAQYTALFMETEPKAEENTPVDGEGEGEITEPENADEAEETGDETDDEEAEDEESNEFDGTAYSPLDPVFGFIKYLTGKLGINLEFLNGEMFDSPMYDALIAKNEIGMSDMIANIAILAMPVALIIYILCALIMAIKAFFGMFGRRIFKCFGLGSIVMIVCAAITLLGGLAFTTDVAGAMEFGGLPDVLLGALTNVGGFTGGFGLLIILALPVITLILSMFARKKIPYSIFDTYGDF